MKKIVYYIIGAAALLAVASCERNLDWNETVEVPAQVLTLNFTTGNMATRAEGDEETVRNYENMVRQIDYFIFAYGEDGKTVPQDAEYVLKGTITPAEGDDQFAILYSTNIEAGNLNKIFPNGNTKAMVFAVANYVDKYGSNPSIENPNTTIPANKKTWKDLHELEVGSTFFYDDLDPNFLLRWPRVMKPECDSLSFVMVGEEEIELKTSGGYAINAEIPLKRLASKVTVDFTYEVVVEHKNSGDITWIPQPSGEETRVFLSNAIEHTTLGGPLDRDLVADSWDTATVPLGDGTRDIFEYAYDFMNDIAETEVEVEGDNGETSTVKKRIAHYYTYPISMEEGDDNQPYLKLVLPWYGYKYVGEGTAPTIEKPEDLDPDDPIWQPYKQKEVYYKIVLPRETICDPNYIYEFSVNVNIIGSDREVKIIGEEYIVKNWLTKDPVSSNVATGRYISLDIPKDEYDMYVDEVDIHFVSSGTVIPHVIEIYQMDLSGSTPTPQYFMQNDEVTASADLMDDKNITADDIKGWVSIPNETSYLKINHAMDNRLLINGQKNDAFDMSPYVFVVNLHLEAAGDDTSFDRTVTITQYPSMYVTSKQSNGSVWVNGRTYDPNGNYNVEGNVGTTQNPIYVTASRMFNDSNYNYDNDAKRIGSVTDPSGALAGSTNNNGYNMIIHPTILEDALNLVLGEARVSTGTTLNYINGVTNYKQTRTDASRMVSPGFMIASSYGKTLNLGSDINRAIERCASYQENGYPAGRWRVPTEGEIEFLVRLSNFGFIPSLFDGRYWGANNRYFASADNQFHTTADLGNNTLVVRCVYDTWYWGEEPYEENATSWLGFRD